jgi:hypothetical protein
MRRARASFLGTTGVSLLALSCVDTSEPPPHATPGMLDTPEPIVLVDEEPVPFPLRERAPTGPYAWENVTIKGGGFVSGLVFGTTVPNLLFARTDVGGAYRFSVAEQRWYPLLDWVGQDDANLLGVESIALDPERAERVYLAAGTYLTGGDGAILRSDDFGESWTRFDIPLPMGGNHPGRSMGERLAVDPSEPNHLFFGSRTGGLWQSANAGETWSAVEVFPVRGDDGLGLSLVVPDAHAGLYVGVATLTGPTLYRSTDGARSFEAVPGAPTGMMPHHAVVATDGKWYLAYNDGPGPNDIRRGAVWRLTPGTDTWTDVSPRQAGFGGVAVDASRPGVVMASTINLWAPDQIFRSLDGGEHWFEIASAAEKDSSGADWLYFGGKNLNATGWMGDLEIDPFNRSRALYVTGQGVWWSDDTTDTDARQGAVFSFKNDGLEETVALDLAAPPEGAPLLSALGDICGFRHDDLSLSPPSGMFQSPLFGNTTSLDFAESAPELVLRVGTGDAGRRGAVSMDGGQTFSAFEAEPLGNGAGTIAVSSDGSAWVWSPDGGVAARSVDGGKTWSACAGVPSGARVVADRVQPDLFYALDRKGVYVSHDGAQGFELTPFELPRGAHLRSVFGHAGHFFISASTGLYRSTDAGASVTRLAAVSSALGVGFGRARVADGYPSIYLSGKVNGAPGLFRSDDDGASFSRISDERHAFGRVGFITGDQRAYGRVYLGTGGRGLVYGDPL